MGQITEQITAPALTERQIRHVYGQMEHIWISLQNRSFPVNASDLCQYAAAILAAVPPLEAPNVGCDDDGEPYTPEALARWLDAKFRRHGELEDEAAAKMIRALAQITPKEPT